MADISQYTDFDMTLNAVKSEIEKQHKEKNNKRNYLGMSEIGEDCWRKLWYGFRQVAVRDIGFKSLAAIEDGYKQEDIMADRLRLLPYIELLTIDPETEKQFAFKYHGGHFCGHCDGKIKGILEAPKTWHIWENKAVNEKKYKDFYNTIMDIGDKSALEKWDYTYYIQAQIYMHSAQLNRHYLTVESPGGRDFTSCRTELNTKDAISAIAKAETIITADKPPARLTDNRSFYKCSAVWCAYREICFDNKVPAVNCRTCAFSDPDIKDKTSSGTWKCFKKNINFTGEGLKDCSDHLFLNTLIPFKAISADDSGNTPNWIKYQLPAGETFYNINDKAKTIPSALCLTSKKIFDAEFFELIFPEEKVNDEKLKAIQEEKKENKKIRGLL